jgi:hypothetical protein
MCLYVIGETIAVRVFVKDRNSMRAPELGPAVHRAHAKESCRELSDETLPRIVAFRVLAMEAGRNVARGGSPTIAPATGRYSIALGVTWAVRAPAAQLRPTMLQWSRTEKFDDLPAAVQETVIAKRPTQK